MKPNTASVALPLVLALASILIGDKGAVLPLVIFLAGATIVKVVTKFKAMTVLRAVLVTLVIWFSIFLTEQKMNPELACYRAAAGSVFTGVSLIPYVGPILNFIGNVEQVRRDKSPNKIRFQSSRPMVEKLSLPVIGLMFSFCFGALRLSITSLKDKSPQSIPL